jgi:glyoxylase-like metal-dependent hydrolase (beta-lactamase superfamily II)
VLKVGKAEVRRVEEQRIAMDIGVLGADEALIAAHESWLAPSFLNPADRTFAMVFQSWLVSLDGLTVLVDPCTGNGRSRPVFPFFDQLDTPYIERFQATGISPEDVDIVFCTHLHCDHCGWNTHLRDGRWVPTFPKARYLLVQREVDRWDPRNTDYPVIDYNVGVFEESVAPLIAAGRADLVEGVHGLGHGLSIEPAYGHTAGHSILRLVSADAEVVFTGDSFHHPLQVVAPELHLGDADDPDAAVATRRRLVAQLAERNALMLPAHFPEPHGGRVRQTTGGGYAFEAIAPATSQKP